MNLELKDKYFVVTGSTSGFGRAVSEALLNEGANLILNGRRHELLDELANSFPGRIIPVCGSVLEEKTRDEIVKKVVEYKPEGIFINAGGPVAGGPLEITLDDLDNAYNLVLRWKVDLVQKIIPYFVNKGYGRFVFLESSSIKQPIDNLALSNTLRMAVSGFVKSISGEMANKGLTFNILAPGFHETEAVKRIFTNKAKLTGLSAEEIKSGMISNTPVQKMGDPNDLASLALWLLSPRSSFVTGQIYTLDGGVVKGN